MMKNETNRPQIARIENTNIGIGFSSSATSGAMIVAVLANVLHIPKHVEAKMVGYR